jgi:hypothetical protein
MPDRAGLTTPTVVPLLFSWSRYTGHCAKPLLEGACAVRRWSSRGHEVHAGCVYRKQLDLETLVSTRGPNFPLSRLESRLMCPACGSRRVTVVFEPPTNRQVRGVMSSHPTAQSSKPRSAIYSRSVSRKRGALSPRVKRPSAERVNLRNLGPNNCWLLAAV